MTKQYDNYADLITFTRASSGTYLDSDGVLKTATTNVPRIEYDADGNRLGLLIEEARTNLLVQSQIDNVAWTKSATTVESAAAIAPDGTLTAVKLKETTDNDFHFTADGFGFTTASGGYYTLSIYAKSSEKNMLRIQINPNADWVGVSNPIGDFNLDTGTFTTSDGATASMQHVGNGWYRCAITAQTNAASSTSSANFHLLENGSTPYTGDGTSGIYLWGAQLEAGSFPTSYIPTSGATATRSADIASIPTSAFGYNQKAGTVVCEATGPAGYDPTSVRNYVLFDVQGVVGTNSYFRSRFFSTTSTTSGTHDAFGLLSGSAQFDFLGITKGVNTNFKTALAFSENDFAFVSTGMPSVQTDTSGNMITPVNLFIGTEGSLALNGHIKFIQYYPRRLTNAQLQELTA